MHLTFTAFTFTLQDTVERKAVCKHSTGKRIETEPRFTERESGAFNIKNKDEENCHTRTHRLVS